MQNSPLVCINIVTWNNEKDIRDCLKSILSQDYPNFKVTVVDNNSSDKTVQIINEEFKNKVEVLAQTENHFYTGGNNIGIQHAFNKYNPEFVLILNPDIYAPEDLLSELIKPLIADSKVGATGPKIKFWKNQNEGLINSAGLFYDGFMEAYHIGFMQEQKEVFAVSGTAILYRAEMLKQIGLYANIKMYLDEVEMFIRVKKAGWKVVYVPSVTLGHNYMQSTNNNKSFDREKQKMKAWLTIALKHYPLKSKLAMIKKYLTFYFKQR